MTILYVDDDRDDCELFTEAFHNIDQSIVCLTATDGQHALQLLAAVAELPDYIFLDVNMPVMDGKSCLVELKNNERFKNIPVVIYSTTADKDEISELYKLGASFFIHKPNNYAALCETLEMFIKPVQM